MPSDHATVFAAALCEVLEKQAFSFAEPVPLPELGSPGGSPLHATITFTGPSSGTAGVAVPAAVATELAASLLGLDPDAEEAEAGAQDALKELLNVASGQFLTTVFGPGPVFQLSIPTVSVMAPADWKQMLSANGTVGLALDDQPLAVHLAVAEDGP